MRNILKSMVVVIALAAVVANSTMAAFTARAIVDNSTFSTGNAALRLLVNLSQPATGQNLTDNLPGPTFNNIYPNWTMDYPLKLVNVGTVNLVASALGVYVSDTSSLRTQIYVEAFSWNDANGNGVVDGGEQGSSLATPMTLEQWRNSAIPLGQIDVAEVVPMVLRFSVGDLDTVYQGQQTVFDFQFDGTTTGASPVVPTPTPVGP